MFARIRRNTRLHRPPDNATVTCWGAPKARERSKVGNLRFVGKWFIPDLRQPPVMTAQTSVGGEAKLGVFGGARERRATSDACAASSYCASWKPMVESAKSDGTIGAWHECGQTVELSISSGKESGRAVRRATMRCRTAARSSQSSSAWTSSSSTLSRWALAGLRDRGERPISTWSVSRRAFSALAVGRSSARIESIVPGRQALKMPFQIQLLVRHPALAQHHRQGPRIDDGVLKPG